MTSAVSAPNLTTPWLLAPGRNIAIDDRDLLRKLGGLSSLDYDLVNLAATVFAADLIVRRGEREAFTRDIDLRVELVNHHAFGALRPNIERILYLLTEDNWAITIGRASGDVEPPSEFPAANGKTLLFSGGLDSFSAAIDELEAGSSLALVSHQTGNRVTKTSQDACFDYLSRNFGERVSRITAKVNGKSGIGYPFPRDKDREYTQRSRSFLFLALAGIVARRTGFHEVLMIAENGQMAIHLPITAARIGAFSTKTAHPHYLDQMQVFLSQLLNCEISIQNPYLYKTKAECVARVATAHTDAIAKTVSCWKSARQAEAHCGECIPCLIRRIAVESCGFTADTYHRDVFLAEIIDLPEDDDGRRNLVELIEFVLWFSGSATDAQLELEFPELVNLHFDKAEVIAMYRRFAAEARAVFANYPNVEVLI